MGGLMDNINDALGNAMTSPLFNMGMGLIQGAQPFQNVGSGLMGAANNFQQQQSTKLAQQQAQMNIQSQRYGLETMQKMMPYVQKALEAAAIVSGPMPTQGQPSAASGAAPGLMGGPSVPNVPQMPGLLGQPMTGAPGPQQGSQAGPQGAASMPQQQAAPAPNDPMALYNRGAQLSSMAGLPYAGGVLGPMGAALTKQAEFQEANDPSLITGREAAKNDFAQTQQQIAANPAMANQLWMSYLTRSGLVHISNNTGAVTAIGGIPLSSLGIETTSNGQITRITPQGASTQNIPGAVAASAQREGAVEAAKSANELAPVFDAKGNQLGFAPRGSIQAQPATTGGGAAPTGPPVSRPGTGATSFGLGPAAKEMLEGNAKTAVETNAQFQKEAEDGKDMVATVQTIKNDAQDFSPGRFADIRQDALDYLRAAGLATPDQLKELGAAQSGQKLSIQLQALVTKALGSREAAQIFGVMGKSIPGLTLSPDGLSRIAAWQEGMARYKMDRAAQANTAAQAGDYQGVNTTRDTWIKNSNPLYYVLASSDPATQREMVKSMRDPKGFVSAWAKAQQSGYAPRPSEYASQ